MNIAQPITNVSTISTTQLVAMRDWLTAITPMATGSRAPLLAQLTAELARRTAETALALASIETHPIGYVAMRSWRP